jgi:hypothetical protein
VGALTQRILSLPGLRGPPCLLVVASDDADVLGAFPLLLELSEGKVVTWLTDG